jgi:leader peptidase (prepilin peptidase)/N-methyltransferase
MLYVPVVIFGLILGSFLNVCIYRIPRELSIVRPSSRCPSCGTPIKIYDNIPVLSYLILGGRCRHCNTGFSVRYPLIELLNAVLYAIVFSRFGTAAPWVLLVYMLFTSTLIVILFIDLEHQIIPDRITLPGIPIAIILGSTVLPDPFLRMELLGLKSSLIGFVSGGGSFYLIAVIGKAILKKDAMGGGDIKMMALIGGILGWKGVILTTFLGSLAGSVVGIVLIMLKGREWGSKLPFGTYLALGAFVSLIYGQEIMNWYLYGG